MLPDAFWSQVQETPTGCWIWTGYVMRGGYGRFRRVAVHRLTYEEMIGEVPSQLQLDHLCHSNDASCIGGDSCIHRRCVNPWHLEPVTALENTRRTARVAKFECKNRHPRTPENTYVKPDSGHRDCRACVRDRARAYSERRSA